jgi:hypothetical protein
MGRAVRQIDSRASQASRKGTETMGAIEPRFSYDDGPWAYWDPDGADPFFGTIWSLACH